MIRKIDLHKRKISTVTLVAILFQLLYPTHSMALTGGPSQPEYESFEPAGATEMVNLATGDFVYNIPLMDVDGYPVNISYHAGITMEQEASWVGLGWSLNNGAINRGMRGLPDDFNGGSDNVSEQINIRPDSTFDATIGQGSEVIGIPVGFNKSFGIVYNNYKGLGFEIELGFTACMPAGSLGGTSLNGGLGVKLSSQDGVDFTTSAGIGAEISVAAFNAGIGVNRTHVVNSRRGLVADVMSGNASGGVSVYGAGFGTTTGSAINLVPNTAYAPNMQYPTTYSGITGEIHAGYEFWWCNLFTYVRGSVFENQLDYGSSTSQTFTKDAYGYLNLENSGVNSLMDFNRDNDGVYYLECPKLPFSNLTYDVYNANAQGLNELVRPYRNDFGYVHDPLTASKGHASSLSLELNYGYLAGIGLNDYSVITNSTSGPWLSYNNAASQLLNFKKANKYTNTSSVFEPSYFKALDELNSDDPFYSSATLGSDLASFKLTNVGGSSTSILQNVIMSNTATTTFTASAPLIKNNREARNTNMSYLTAGDASKYALEKVINSYSLNTFNYTSAGDIDPSVSTTTVSRSFGLSNDNHMSEMTVLKDDGARYVYGLPVYNHKYKEVIFNSAGLTPNSSQEVSYGSSDNAISNTRGKDHFFLGRDISPFAHSYLLTALLSKDYVDITGDGPSQDDYGDYTKFNYTRTSTNYGWRNPITASTTTSSAVFDPVWKSDATDDKGTYVYGQKEIWYPHSIETKNYVAEFHTSSRDDAHGAGNENGATSTASGNSLMKLDKIVLYSKKDRSTPIKIVNFEYSYKLCQGTPNSLATSTNGKLTLEKVYFTYGSSNKGVFAPYTFSYCDFDHNGTDDADINQNYSREKTDRWGNYQDPSQIAPFDSHDFPYTPQNKAAADVSASLWSLSSITTPAKSRIDVYYESDDYAYIQEKAPGQMLTLRGFSQFIPNSVPSASTALSGVQLYTNSTPNNYMIVDLTRMSGGGMVASSTFSLANAAFQSNVLPSSSKLYFKSLVALSPAQNVIEEYVSGYADIDIASSSLMSIGVGTTAVAGQSVYPYAYIKLKDVDIEDGNTGPGDNCSPVSKAAWQFTRLYQPKVAYPGSEPGGNTLYALAGLVGSLSEVLDFHRQNKRLRDKGYARYCKPGYSMVRLNIPGKTKYGGGHRVKKIEILDNWDQMVSSESATTYGQTYDYTTADGSTAISSGVASYEPLAGGDEISLRQPVEYSVKHQMAPNDAHFFEAPVGESFLPPPTIIYSKVTVKNIDRGSVANNIGRTEYEFYTVKDFPFSSEYTPLYSFVHTPNARGGLFSKYQENAVQLSQGYILRLNNMHGKLKSILTFQEGASEPISGSRYYYSADGNELYPYAPVIDETGAVSVVKMGEHVESVADFRSQASTTKDNSKMGNLNITPLQVGPYELIIPIPSYFWGNSTQTRDFYSATLNKVVTRQGILQRVETISDYAVTTTVNRFWDEKTHEVLLSQTSTNYGTYDYHYHTPAHYVYKGMSGAYQNVGLSLKTPVTMSTGAVSTVVTSAGLLKEGDEVELVYTNTLNVPTGTYADRLWISDNGSGTTVLMDRDGKVCTSGASTSTSTSVFSGVTNYVLKVMRSGYRNILDESAENISFSDDPYVVATSSINYTANVIDASATEFSDSWQKLCRGPNDGCTAYADLSCLTATIPILSNTNPYINNTKGRWNPVRNYSYLGSRSTNVGSTRDIRKDGVFTSYEPFFLYQSGSWEEVYASSRSNSFTNWILNSEITKISAEGNVIEAKDAINRFSSSLYNYNSTLKSASAVNAKQRDIGTESFEDFDFADKCINDHLGFYIYHNQVTAGIAHTGRHSMKIAGGACAFVARESGDPDYQTAYGRNYSVLAIPTPTAMQPANCLKEWSPVVNWTSDQKYVFSFWMKESALAAAGTYTSVGFTVTSPSSVSNIAVLKGSSPVINGWQKFDYEFNLAAGLLPGSVILRFDNAGAGDVYIDDIRVQPFNSSMTTYVYDPLSLRIWSELDERNYATTYEYDQEGVLVRVKKETERGIFTIKETRNSFKKL